MTYQYENRKTWPIIVVVLMLLLTGCVDLEDDPEQAAAAPMDKALDESTESAPTDEPSPSDTPTPTPIPTPPTPSPQSTTEPPEPTPTPTPTPTPVTSGPYTNCTEARAAGAAPVRVGDPGYGTHLDRDGDGIGCE